MNKSMLAAAALLAASACDRGREEPANQTGGQSAQPAAERIEQMPEGQRNAVFIRAIRDAGMDCQSVESSTSSGDYQGMPVWTARCGGGQEWTIVIGDNGIAQLLNPNEAQLLEKGSNAAATEEAAPLANAQ